MPPLRDGDHWSPGILQRRAGKIIDVSSLGAFLATPNLGAYAASKAALNALTRTTANECSAADYINGVSLPLDGGLLVVP